MSWLPAVTGDRQKVALVCEPKSLRGNPCPVTGILSLTLSHAAGAVAGSAEIDSPAVSAPLEIINVSYDAQQASMSVSFNSEPGAAYVLEYSTTLAQGDWLPLNEGIVAQDTGASVVDAFPDINAPRIVWLRIRKRE